MFLSIVSHPRNSLWPGNLVVGLGISGDKSRLVVLLVVGGRLQRDGRQWTCVDERGRRRAVAAAADATGDRARHHDVVLEHPPPPTALQRSTAENSGVFSGTLAPATPFGSEKIVVIFNVKNMLTFKHFWKCTSETYMYPPPLRRLVLLYNGYLCMLPNSNVLKVWNVSIYGNSVYFSGPQELRTLLLLFFFLLFLCFLLLSDFQSPKTLSICNRL